MKKLVLPLVFMAAYAHAETTTTTTRTTRTVTRPAPQVESQPSESVETPETSSMTSGAESSGIVMDANDSTATSETGAAETPATVCRSLAEAAKAKNFEVFKNSSTGMHKPSAKAPKKAEFEKMSERYMSHLQDLNCGTEVVADDHAVVEAESKGEKRLIPFVRMSDGWKFDTKTYQSFYHTDERPGMKKKKN